MKKIIYEIISKFVMICCHNPTGIKAISQNPLKLIEACFILWQYNKKVF